MQKYGNPVDLGESFPPSIYLQKSASIQPRTRLSKFGGKFNLLFIRLLSNDLVRLRTFFVEVRTQSHESHFVSRSALSRSFRRRDGAYISLSTKNKILKNRDSHIARRSHIFIFLCGENLSCSSFFSSD